MPIMPLEDFPPLPKHHTEETRAARERGACPIQTFDWYRLPDLFNLCIKAFGRSFYNFQSKTRKHLDAQLTFVCSCFRDKYMPACSTERMDRCCALLEDAVRATIAFGPSESTKIPYQLVVLRNLINSEQANEVLKPTVPRTIAQLPSAVRSVEALDTCCPL